MEPPSPESSSPPPSTPSAAEKTILRWDSTASDHSPAREKMIFSSSDRLEIDSYLSAVDELQKTLSKTSLSATSSSAASSSTLQIAMARLEDEFRSVLISYTSPMDSDSLLLNTSQDEDEADENEEKEEQVQDFDGEKQIEHLDSTTSTISISSSRYKSTSSIREMDLIPCEAVNDLRLIAQRMISANYVRECVQVYASVRKSSVDATLQGLNVAKLSIGDIQRLEWDALEAQIRRWIRAAKVCVRVVFASERRLCEQVFQGLDSSITSSSSLESDGEGSVNYTTGLGTVGDMCFLETLKGPAIQLFNFAEAISISRRSPEKLFKILDLHDAFSDLLPDIEAVFDSKSCESIRVQAVEILSRLAEAARGILSEFESAVLREPSRVPVPGGTIHPLTRYVMNYISLISDYKQTLAELIVSKPAMGSRYSSDPNTPDVDLSEFENHQSSVLALHLIWIIVTLHFNLEGKSKHYKDASLAHLFMMNNVHYIVQKVKGSPELREMIGDDYLRKLTGKFRLSATNYQRATWVRVLYCLRDEGLHMSGSFSSGVSKTALRERFKSFNAMFEEVHRTQATWFVPDSQLREELRISISEKVIPAYRSFLGRFRSHIESGKHPENYIKYSVEDLENAVLDFFEGYPVSQHLRRRLSDTLYTGNWNLSPQTHTTLDSLVEESRTSQ